MLDIGWYDSEGNYMANLWMSRSDRQACNTIIPSCAHGTQANQQAMGSRAPELKATVHYQGLGHNLSVILH